jgi:hypothetical protein
MVVAAAVLLGVPLWLLWPPAPGATSPAPAGRPQRRAARPAPATPAAELPERNVFEFVAPVVPRTTRPAPMAPPPPPVDASPAVSAEAPPAVRLIGLVHRRGELRAALSLLGNVVILGAGEEAEGYRVLSIDEEAGVRLRNPDGTEQSLSRPETP